MIVIHKINDIQYIVHIIYRYLIYILSPVEQIAVSVDMLIAYLTTSIPL